MTASWMASAAPASTPQVGWLITSTLGSCSTSRPTRNFCRLPPDSDLRERGLGPGGAHVEPGDDVLREGRGALAAGSGRAAPAPARSRAERNAFSASDMVVTAPCPLRSSGTKQPRSRRRSFGPMCPAGHAIDHYRLRPAGQGFHRTARPSARSARCPRCRRGRGFRRRRRRERDVVQVGAELVGRPHGQPVQHQARRRIARQRACGRAVGARSSALIMISASSLTVFSAGVQRGDVAAQPHDGGGASTAPAPLPACG